MPERILSLKMAIYRLMSIWYLLGIILCALIHHLKKYLKTENILRIVHVLSSSFHRWNSGKLSNLSKVLQIISNKVRIQIYFSLLQSHTLSTSRSCLLLFPSIFTVLTIDYKKTVCILFYEHKREDFASLLYKNLWWPTFFRREFVLSWLYNITRK